MVFWSSCRIAEFLLYFGVFQMEWCGVEKFGSLPMPESGGASYEVVGIIVQFKSFLLVWLPVTGDFLEISIR